MPNNKQIYRWNATITNFITFTYTIATFWVTKYLTEKHYKVCIVIMYSNR